MISTGLGAASSPLNGDGVSYDNFLSVDGF